MLVALIPALLGALLLFEVYRIISSHSGLDSNDQQFMAENINSALPLKFDFTKYSLNRQENLVASLDDLGKQFKIQYSAVKGSSNAKYFERMAYIENRFYE